MVEKNRVNGEQDRGNFESGNGEKRHNFVGKIKKSLEGCLTYFNASSKDLLFYYKYVDFSDLEELKKLLNSQKINSKEKGEILKEAVKRGWNAAENIMKEKQLEMLLKSEISQEEKGEILKETVKKDGKTAINITKENQPEMPLSSEVSSITKDIQLEMLLKSEISSEKIGEILKETLRKSNRAAKNIEKKLNLISRKLNIGKEKQELILRGLLEKGIIYNFEELEGNWKDRFTDKEKGEILKEVVKRDIDATNNVTKEKQLEMLLKLEISQEEKGEILKEAVKRNWNAAENITKENQLEMLLNLEISREEKGEILKEAVKRNWNAANNVTKEKQLEMLYNSEILLEDKIEFIDKSNDKRKNLK